MKSFDVVVIGAGQAGIPLAKALAGEGQHVALVEQARLGGSCVNFGCTPTKAALASARVAHLARRARDFGIDVGEVRPDFAAVIARAAAMAEKSNAALEKALAGPNGPTLIRAHAKFDGRDGARFRTDADGQVLLSPTVILDTGARSTLPPIDGIDEVPVLTAENWLALRTLPRHVLMVGAGYIGLEMGQFYRRMGAEVTVVGSDRHVASHEDADVSEALQQCLEAEGLKFVLGARATRLRRTGDDVTVSVTDKETGVTREVVASHVFVAAGRQPNTDDLGLESIGLTPAKDGTLEVDEQLRTQVQGVWAVGDIRGGPMFTHTSWDDFRVVRSCLVGDGSHTTDRVVPYALFTDPELGRVGMTESQAREAGHRIQVGRFALRDNGKARESGESDGFIKVVVECDTHQILGAAVLCAHGAELVHVYITMMNARVPWPVLRDAVQIHPTLSEALQSAVASLSSASSTQTEHEP